MAQRRAVLALWPDKRLLSTLGLTRRHQRHFRAGVLPKFRVNNTFASERRRLFVLAADKQRGNSSRHDREGAAQLFAGHRRTNSKH